MSQHHLRELILLLSLSLLVTGALATDAPTITVLPADNTLDVGETTTVAVLLDTVPTGLSGFNITVTLTDPSVGELTAITYPDWAVMPVNSSLPADTVYAQTVDLMGSVGSGATNVTLCTLTFRGDATGKTDLTITATKVDDDVGGRYAPTITPASITVGTTPTPTTGLSFTPVVATVTSGDIAQYAVVMNSVPAGLSGFNISVALTDPSIGEITAITYPTWALMPVNGSLPTDAVYAQAVDLTGSIGAGVTNVTLCTLTVRGDAAGETNLTITAMKVDDDVGGRYAPTTADAILIVKNLALAPVANFTANVTTGTIPLTVQFTDTSTGDPTNWSWDFGDGMNSTEQHPVHTYTVAGTYTVSLTAQNADGENTLTRTGYIMVTETPAEVTCIHVLPASSTLITGQTQTYTMTLDTAPAGLSGFNLSVQLTDPAVAEIVDVQYPSWASLPTNSTLPADEVWCKVVDLTGASGTTEITLVTVTVRADAAGTTNITVLPNRIEDRQGGRYTPTVAQAQLQVEVSARLLVANFTANVTSGTTPLTVQFTDMSTGNPTNWSWTFGDGATSTEQHPVHTYTAAGTYTVTLAVANTNTSDALSRAGYITALPVGPIPITGPTVIITPGHYALQNTISNSPSTCIWITTSDVIFDGMGYTIDGTDTFGTYGVYVYNDTEILSNVTIRNLTVTDWGYGIHYINATASRLEEIRASSNGNGIDMRPCSDSSLENITASSNNNNGITLFASSNRNNLTQITANNNGYSGIMANGAHNTQIEGIQAIDNNWLGIYLYGGGDDSIIDNASSENNQYGISVWYSKNVTIANSTIRSNSVSGIDLKGSTECTFFNNYLKNTVNVELDDTSAGNIWNVTRSAGVNIVGGSWLGGNYWANPSGNGHSETAPDSNGDGICDQILDLGRGNIDLLPLGGIKGLLPDANFTAMPLSGIVPLTVQFNDLSTGGPTSWNWTFGDGSTSLEQHPIHTFTAAGNYTVSLTVGNVAGNDTETKQGYVTATTPPVQNTLSFDPVTSEVTTGQTMELDVVLDTVPTGLSGFNISVVFTDPSVAEIIDISYPTWANLPVNGSLPADAVYAQAVDLMGSVGAGATNVTLCTLTVRGDAAGETNLTITATKVDDDVGGRYTPETTDAVLIVENSLLTPAANFTANITAGTIPLTVQFTDTSTGDPTNWSWSFGDGNASTERHPIHTYTRAGTYTVSLRASGAGGYDWEHKTNFISVSPPPSGYYMFSTKWGSQGSGEGEFDFPTGIAINQSGYIYVTEWVNNRTQVFDQTGTHITEWGSSGSGIGQFKWPSDIAVNSSGYLYITDAGNNRIQVFDPSGAYISQWGVSGSGEGQLFSPRALSVNASDYVYVADYGNDRVQVFDPSGVYQCGWSAEFPLGIEASDSGWVYVTESNNHRMRIFDPSGTLVSEWGSRGSGDGQFDFPTDVTVDKPGFIYVIDENNARIQIFDPSGMYITQWGSYGSEDWQLGSPKDITVNQSGYVYLAERIWQIKVLAPSSTVTPIAGFGANITTGKVPLTVQFTGGSIGSSSSWFWIFGDGATSTEQNPVHTYTTAGNYTVSLTVGNVAGNDTETKQGYITGTTPTVQNTLSFNPATSETITGQTVELDVVLDTVPDGLSGFNISVALTDPSIGEIVSISYPTWAFMPVNNSLPADTVCAQAVDLMSSVGAGATNVTLCTLTVRGDAAGETNLTIVATKIDDDVGGRYAPRITGATLFVEYLPVPAANFTANLTSGPIPLTIQFADTSSNDPASWLWTFGDGNTSTEQHPVHTYRTPGNYSVSLTVSNGNSSDTLSRPDYITVTRVKGDFNGDGAVDIGDVSKVAYMVVGKVAADPAADFNENGAVDIGDAAKIAYYYVEKIPAL